MIGIREAISAAGLSDPRAASCFMSKDLGGSAGSFAGRPYTMIPDVVWKLFPFCGGPVLLWSWL